MASSRSPALRLLANDVVDRRARAFAYEGPIAVDGPLVVVAGGRDAECLAHVLGETRALTPIVPSANASAEPGWLVYVTLADAGAPRIHLYFGDRAALARRALHIGRDRHPDRDRPSRRHG